MAASVELPERRHRPPPPKKPGPGQPWSHDETFALIGAYEEKWYALKRGQLRAHQWEEVADAVASRCSLETPPKSGTQCRHKIEKLRKRYRAERLRIAPSTWPYFARMDHMDRGPLPVAARSPESSSDDDEGDDGEEEEVDERNTRSINGILRTENRGAIAAPRNPEARKRSFFEEDEDEGNEAMLRIAAAVRRFGEGMARMEKRRMEIMREVERDWMEVEARRAKMVMESERRLMEMISSFKKAKKSHDV